MFLDKQKLIELGLKKKNGIINKTWDELAEPYGISGERLRDWCKKFQKKNGTLPGKYENGKLKVLILNDLHIPDHQEELILDIIKQNHFVDLIILNGY